MLDPEPPPERIAEVLGRYRFRDVPQAYSNLMALSTEKIRFLSTRRCRHFLAAIAPRLLAAIAATPDPDFDAGQPEQGERFAGRQGRAVGAVQLQSAHAAAVRRAVLVEPVPVGHPDQQPGHDRRADGQPGAGQAADARACCDATLAELCRGAEDIDPILHSFKNAQQLRVGVRDILGKEDDRGHDRRAVGHRRSLPASRSRASEYEKLAAKLGEPTIGEGDRGRPSRASWSILALGKFGGRELNYHSDLDLVFLYEADGTTVHAAPHAPRRRPRPTSISSASWASGSSRSPASLGPYGRLYEIDPRLRPTGKSGSLATSLAEFAATSPTAQGQLWERQALCKARVVYGSPPAAARGDRPAIREAAFAHAWQPNDAEAIRQMRQRLEETAAPGNLKRGPGGTGRHRVPGADAAAQARRRASRRSRSPARSTRWPRWTPPAF